MNFMGAKNVSFRANGVLTFSMVYELLIEKKEKVKQQKNKSNKTCSLTTSLLQVNFLLMSFLKMTPLKA